jgi:DNA replication and repair protein RecF
VASAAPASPRQGAGDSDRSPGRLWVARITLTNFRNYDFLALDLGPQPVVLVGANGSGKTNILEAVSLLTPGQGLRRAPLSELARRDGDGSWSVAARIETRLGAVDIGTGLAAGSQVGERPARTVRIDGETKASSGALADFVEMIWVTPAMDGLFTGPASERRRFLDRLIVGFDPGHTTRLGRFERAMQQRNRLLADGVRDHARLEGLEIIMAETGVAIAAARAEAVAALSAVVQKRRDRDPSSPFPWSVIASEGAVDSDLARQPAVEVEDRYIKILAEARERDRAVGRTLDGPHRSDLIVHHGPKAMPARLCSSGEQKALLLGLVLAHAELVRERRDGTAPILLLDEIAAHLDEGRRSALFAEILALGAQAWMTGTDYQPFAALAREAQFWSVDNGHLAPLVAGSA